MKKDITLAEFISSTRENIGLSQKGLSDKANIDLPTIERLESGQELFMASTIRQKLSRALKLEPKQLKYYERQPKEPNEVSLAEIEEIKHRILEESLLGHICPVCKSELICRVATMYDLEDNLIRHPKARCSKCPFQIK